MILQKAEKGNNGSRLYGINRWQSSWFYLLKPAWEHLRRSIQDSVIILEDLPKADGSLMFCKQKISRKSLKTCSQLVLGQRLISCCVQGFKWTSFSLFLKPWNLIQSLVQMLPIPLQLPLPIASSHHSWQLKGEGDVRGFPASISLDKSMDGWVAGPRIIFTWAKP